MYRVVGVPSILPHGSTATYYSTASTSAAPNLGPQRPRATPEMGHLGPNKAQQQLQGVMLDGLLPLVLLVSSARMES
ncbi:hypothetical protein VPNG_05541 [Cytospora leucostoma]|uniref:Uncharacterized protein n=1 Tax=Cytospora leucostoma TaxID=1230097 RepID=A0A423X6V8_9PEZI|nr:hypothetical protein VPNG_05541 [Cytospora leucostoma]